MQPSDYNGALSRAETLNDTVPLIWSFRFVIAIMATYESWTVFALKQELVRRGAVTRGRKKDLIERYANNASEIEALCCGFTAKLSPGGAATPTRALCVCVWLFSLSECVSIFLVAHQHK